MKAQILLNPCAQKHLVAKALTKYLDFKRRTFVAYGVTNMYFLYHLGFEFEELYAAGCFVRNKLNATKKRPESIVLENGEKMNSRDFEINGGDTLLKGANALWYENGKKRAAVAAADENGGTYGNVYLKAAARGAKVVIPVTHEKLIPFYEEATQNVEYSRGLKIAMLEFFYGEVFSEMEAFKELFELSAKVIASGGILGNEGSVVFQIEGDEKSCENAFKFVEKFENEKLEEKVKKDFMF
jgi:hypothetical protein